MEFLSDGLAEGSADVLAHLRLASIDGDGAAFGNVQPSAQILRQRLPPCAPALLRLPLRKYFSRSQHQENGNASAETFEKLSSINSEAAEWDRGIDGRVCEFVALRLDGQQILGLMTHEPNSSSSGRRGEWHPRFADTSRSGRCCPP